MKKLIEKTSLHIIDGTNFMNRAWYAVPPLKTSKGVHTNAVKGFVNILEKIKRVHHPTHLVIVFDGPRSKEYRIKLLGSYKGTREKDPKKEKEFFPQFKLMQKVLDACRIPHFSIEGFEADDVIGSLVKHNYKEVDEVFVHSSDKDFAQLLIKDKIKQCRPETQKSPAVIVTKHTCIDVYGVHPKQIINYLQLISDKVDAVPGVPGIGPVKAQKLLAEHGDLDTILDNVGSFPKGMQKSFAECDVDFSLTYKLIKLRLDLPEVKDLELDTFIKKQPNMKKLTKVKKLVEFVSIFGY